LASEANSSRPAAPVAAPSAKSPDTATAAFEESFGGAETPFDAFPTDDDQEADNSSSSSAQNQAQRVDFASAFNDSAFDSTFNFETEGSSNEGHS